MVDFDRAITGLQSVARPLLLEVLKKRGARIDEMEEWKITLGEKQLVPEGELEESGLMRLSSIFELPSDLIEDPEEKVDADNPHLYATQSHFKAVRAIVDDPFSQKFGSFGEYAHWAEKYAKKIDRLPLLHVDTEMQEYSAKVAEILRQGAEAFRGTVIRSSARQKQVWSSNYVTFSYDGWRNYDAQGQEQSAIRAQETARGATDSAAMRRMLDDMTGDIRRVMVARYKVEF